MRVIARRRNRQRAEIERRRDACRGKQARPHGIVGRLGPARAVEIDCIDPGPHEIAEQRPTQHAERDEETKHPNFGIRTEHNELAFQKEPDEREWLHNCEPSSPAQHAKTPSQYVHTFRELIEAPSLSYSALTSERHKETILSHLMVYPVGCASTNSEAT